ncbi:MAG: hypothetical protein K5840_01445 [Eubacterium sp.]|nr:hypothetical protein [Eubacterium sp.]
MYSQFFGNYLLERKILNKEELLDALGSCVQSEVAPPFIAVFKGYMSQNEADILAMEAEKANVDFYDYCVEKGIISSDQVYDIVGDHVPHYLHIAQYLIKKKKVESDDMIQLLADYMSQFELIDLDFMTEISDAVDQLMVNFSSVNENEYSGDLIDYFTLLFNNLINYIGSDFSPLSLQPFAGYCSKICASQNILGKPGIYTAIDMNEETAVLFASRFAKYDFSECDEYVEAALADFLNQHNGLYIVNASNERNRELTLDAPTTVNYDVLSSDGEGYFLNCKFSFGFVNFYIMVVEDNTPPASKLPKP